MAGAVMPLLLLLLLLPLLLATAASGGGYKETTTTTHIKVFWHDAISGPDPTAMVVARTAATNASKTLFGLVVVIDDVLTEGPDLNSSKPLGRAEGIYISTGRNVASVLMDMNFVFEAGRYNGSTVTIMGRNAVLDPVREMIIVGGTGVFRGARGYVLASTHSFNQNTGDATVEYNLYISH